MDKFKTSYFVLIQSFTVIKLVRKPITSSFCRYDIINGDNILRHCLPVNYENFEIIL